MKSPDLFALIAIVAVTMAIDAVAGWIWHVLPATLPALAIRML